MLVINAYEQNVTRKIITKAATTVEGTNIPGVCG